MNTQWLLDHVYLIALYPLIAFVLIVAGRGLIGPGIRKEWCSAATILATFLGLLHTGFGPVAWLAGHADRVLETNINWLTAGDFTLSVGTLLDGMSVMMLVVVTFISLLIQIYTHGYMGHDKGYAKFYAYLALFNFSMLGLVLSTNLFQIYIFWEMVGVSSYLLIGFWFTRPSAAAAAVKAFLMNRVGDFGFLFGILGFLYYSLTAWQAYLPAHPEQALLSFKALGEIAPMALAAAGPGMFTAICILIFMGPMAKSAQVPLHTWLPDAMEGPTPISALIHAATMVAAGVFLIGRVYPIFTLSETAMTVVAAIGVITAVVGASIAIVQYDIKKALAYSTMSQLGFMVAAMGIGAFTAGLFHLFTHAFFKAMLFLCSGQVIHACEEEQDMRKMGGLRRKLPWTAAAYLIGTCAISGILWTSGFWSKDLILEGALAQHKLWVFCTLATTAGVTSFYMFRTWFMTFTGEYRGTAHVHHEDRVMWIPLAILAVPSLVIGGLLAGLSDLKWFSFAEYVKSPFADAFVHRAGVVHEAGHHTFVHAISSQLGLISLGVGAAGLALAYWFYGTKDGSAIPEKIRTTPGFHGLFNLFTRKWYFDDLYQGFVDRVYLAFARGSAGFDRNAIDGVVNWTGRSVTGSGYLLKELQSGRVQTYVAVMFFGVVTLSLLLFYGLR